MKNTIRIAISTVLLCSVALVEPVLGGPIIQPTGVSTTANEFLPIGRTIDQSGLGAAYVSGVTDFDTFVAATGHNNSNATTWLSNLIFPKLVTFDLGALFGIDGFALWHTLPNTTIRDFDLFSDTDNNFGNGGTTSLGAFTAPNSGGVSGHSFSFSQTSTQFVHLRINNHYGGVDVRVGEFAFRSTIPEPGEIALLGVGVLGLIGGYVQRKRLLR